MTAGAPAAVRPMLRLLVNEAKAWALDARVLMLCTTDCWTEAAVLTTVKLTATPMANTRRRAVVMSVTRVTFTALDATPRLVAMEDEKALRAVVVNVPDVSPASVMLLDTLYNVIVAEGGDGTADDETVFFFKPTPRPTPKPSAMRRSRIKAPPQTSVVRLLFAGCCAAAAPVLPSVMTTTAGCIVPWGTEGAPLGVATRRPGVRPCQAQPTERRQLRVATGLLRLTAQAKARTPAGRHTGGSALGADRLGPSAGASVGVSTRCARLPSTRT